MTATLRVRTAKAEDFSACKTIVNQKENRAGFGRLFRPTFEDFATRAKSDPRYHIAVAVQGRRIVGFVRALHRADGSHCTVHEICRDIHFKGAGVGPLLMDHVANAARAQGLPQLFLQTPQRADAWRAYERLGFQRVGKTESRKGTPLWAYAKPL